MSNILDLLKLNLLNYQNAVESHGMKLGIQICLDEINKISNDVAEVVRCKDCNKSVCIGERYFCDIQYDEWGQPYVVKPDGYCDCGERKKTDE